MKTILIAWMASALLTSSGMASEWWENVKVKGDLRYRHEMIDQEGKDVRNRQRIRGRIGISGQVNPNIKVGVQLATGSSDPVSTNQTLGDGFSSKSIVLDLAYFTMTHKAVPGLTVTAGKFKNPFFLPGESELIWDSDFNPEGGTASYEYSEDKLKIALIGAGLYAEERSSDGDSWIGAGQGVAELALNDGKSNVAAGGGFFHYGNLKGFEPLFDGEPKGNSVDSVDRLANGYDLIELFAQVETKLDDIPVTVMGDYVTNTAADSLKTGWLIGCHVGKLKDPGSWAFRYNYRELKKDAVIGTFTDSDFRGGGTDAKGHELVGSVQVMKNAAFGATYFINTVGLDAAKSDYSKLQVDLQLKFQ
ncbi:MAG: putative porin [Candidatus Zixiibacteriota bacterium]